MRRRQDIPGDDINCGYTDYTGAAKSYCQIDGDLTEMAYACDANKNCKAFTSNDSLYSGFLKSAAGPTTYREGYITFVKR